MKLSVLRSPAFKRHADGTLVADANKAGCPPSFPQMVALDDSRTIYLRAGTARGHGGEIEEVRYRSDAGAELVLTA